VREVESTIEAQTAGLIEEKKGLEVQVHGVEEEIRGLEAQLKAKQVRRVIASFMIFSGPP
jgi:hypothetical protein